MASYTKRGNSYRLRASCGYTPEGKQVVKSRTWTPAPGMTEKQIEKELNRQMVLFDEECRGSSLRDGHIKFKTFAEKDLLYHTIKPDDSRPLIYKHLRTSILHDNS